MNLFVFLWNTWNGFCCCEYREPQATELFYSQFWLCYCHHPHPLSTSLQVFFSLNVAESLYRILCSSVVAFPVDMTSCLESSHLPSAELFLADSVVVWLYKDSCEQSWRLWCPEDMKSGVVLAIQYSFSSPALIFISLLKCQHKCWFAITPFIDCIYCMLLSSYLTVLQIAVIIGQQFLTHNDWFSVSSFSNLVFTVFLMFVDHVGQMCLGFGLLVW